MKPAKMTKLGRQPRPGSAAKTVAVLLTSVLLRLAADDFQGATHLMPFDEDVIHYGRSKDANPVSRLQERIDRGEVTLQYAGEYGFLPSLLKELKIATNSQMLVFSKTSFQRERISPRTPRALYFNDEVYVGFIPGAPSMEISAADPALGGVFYTLAQTRTERPRLIRTDQCLECHASAYSMGIPGHLARSFATDESGAVDLLSGLSQVNHRTPLAERWGGWYVTGSAGGQAHRGNLIGKAAFERQERNPGYSGDLTNLSGFFDTSRYPGVGSDIVALMVLEHQTHLHNYLTRLNYEATVALRQYGHLNYLKSKIEAFLRYLLFTEEAPLKGPIEGNTGFARQFVEVGPKDKQGRSLREFNLRTRLFKYPCSYLIYSESFDRLPDELKVKLYRRLWEILSGGDTGPDYQNMSAGTRRAIMEILCGTKPGLPEYWKP